jgi:hypothetical protein
MFWLDHADPHLPLLVNKLISSSIIIPTRIFLLIPQQHRRKLMTFAAVFAIIVGFGMIGQWTMSFVTKQVPELKSEPYRIWFHIAGEMTTALLLIVAGIAALAGFSWTLPVYLISMGMLAYTVIVSPGYFAQKGQWIWVVIFAILLGLAVISSVTIWNVLR